MTNTILAISEYTALIEHNFPQVRVQTAHPITRGWDSLVLEVNDELIFRFPMREDVVQRQQQEQRSLPHFVGHLLPQERVNPRLEGYQDAESKK